jgi:hypothetical protein
MSPGSARLRAARQVSGILLADIVSRILTEGTVVLNDQQCCAPAAHTSPRRSLIKPKHSEFQGGWNG